MYDRFEWFFLHIIHPRKLLFRFKSILMEHLTKASYIYVMLTYKDEVVSHYHPCSSQCFDTCMYMASQTERRDMEEKMSKITFRHKLN